MPRATHDRPASRTQTQRKCRTQTQNAKRKTHGTAVRFSMPFPLFFRALHLMLASSSGVSKCFLAKSPVGSLPLANFGMPHCSGHSLTEAQVLLRETVSGEEGARRRGCRPRSPAPTLPRSRPPRARPFPPPHSRARSAIVRPLTALRLSPSLPPKKAKKRAGAFARSFSSQCLSCSRSRQEPWTCSKT